MKNNFFSLKKKMYIQYNIKYDIIIFINSFILYIFVE